MRHILPLLLAGCGCPTGSSSSTIAVTIEPASDAVRVVEAVMVSPDGTTSRCDGIGDASLVCENPLDTGPSNAATGVYGLLLTMDDGGSGYEEAFIGKTRCGYLNYAHFVATTGDGEVTWQVEVFH